MGLIHILLPFHKPSSGKLHCTSSQETDDESAAVLCINSVKKNIILVARALYRIGKSSAGRTAIGTLARAFPERTTRRAHPRSLTSRANAATPPTLMKVNLM